MDNLRVADHTQVSNSLLQNVAVGKRREKTADSLMKPIAGVPSRCALRRPPSVPHEANHLTSS